MAEMLKLQGQATSPGMALGYVHLAADVEEVFVPASSAASERALLTRAIEDSVTALRRLASETGQESGGLIAFQVEMLLDPELIITTNERIERGDCAALAWITALDEYIAGFARSNDEHIRARASDITDIKHRVLAAMTGKPMADFPRGSVFVGDDLLPSRFLAHDWSGGGGIVLFQGSPASHVSMLARAKSVPMVIGTGRFAAPVEGRVIVNGDAGEVVFHPSETEMRQVRARMGKTKHSAEGGPKPCLTADGVAIDLSINVNDLTELGNVDPAAMSGIGLFRSEFLVSSSADLFNEERQYAAYCQLLDWAGSKPVTIRLLDLGGDKPLPSAEAMKATSFLGLRGIRLLLARQEILRVQVRALLRAATRGKLLVMLPMITLPSELTATRQVFSEEAIFLHRQHITNHMPEIGMMVEVPAAAIMLDTFAEADFYSFGTNDLAQYLTAAARDVGEVANIHTHGAPAVLRLIEQSMHLAKAMKKPVSICGDMASQAEFVPDLLLCGLRHFSLAPAKVESIRSTIGRLNADGKLAAER